MNKAEFVDRIAARTGDRQAAKEVVDVAIDEIQRAVVKGEKVSFAGFGVFEKRQRAARMARNPRTGEAVKVKKTVIPAFRPGTGFKELVTGKRKMSRAAGVKKAAAKKAAAKKAAKKTTRAAGAGTRSVTTGRVSSGAKKTAAKKTTAKKATRKTATKAAAKKTTAKKTPARKTTAKRSGRR